MLRQLARNAMHHTPIVENHKIALSPPVRVNSLRRERAPLQVPANAPDLGEV
jgi:hypothetical protein